MKNMASPSSLTANRFLNELRALASDAQLRKYERFFPVEKRGDDIFIGVGMGQVFALAKIYMNMSLKEVERLLESPVHEARVGAVSILDFQARNSKTTDDHKKELYELYLRRHDCINAWDLVDRSAIHVVGKFALHHPAACKKLYRLAKSKNVWERRTAMVSAIAFIGHKEVAHGIAIAELLIGDSEDTIHKATGWFLRTMGGEDLIRFLDAHAASMSRVTLRYATEKLSAHVKGRYL